MSSTPGLPEKFYTCSACGKPVPYDQAVFFDLQSYHKEHAPRASGSDNTLRTDLLALTALRERVVRENDVVGRLFKTLQKDETPAPTWDDLDRAVKAIEQKVPGWYLWYFPEERAYALLPNAEYKPQAQGGSAPRNISESEQEA